MRAPFDLQKAMNGASLVCRDGRKATFIGYCEKLLRPVLLQVDGHELAVCLSKEGTRDYPRLTQWDLFLDIPHTHQALMDEVAKDSNKKVQIHITATIPPHWADINAPYNWVPDCKYRIKPESKTVWVNLYTSVSPSGKSATDGMTYSSRAEAHFMSKNSPYYVGTFPITLLEGS